MTQPKTPGVRIELMTFATASAIGSLTLLRRVLTLTTPKPPWKERKNEYIGHLPHVSTSVQMLVAADKLHNVRCILRDHRILGEAIWSRFSATKDESLWYYRAVTEALRRRDVNLLVEELDRNVKELERVAYLEHGPIFPDLRSLEDQGEDKAHANNLNRLVLEPHGPRK